MRMFFLAMVAVVVGWSSQAFAQCESQLPTDENAAVASLHETFEPGTYFQFAVDVPEDEVSQLYYVQICASVSNERGTATYQGVAVFWSDSAGLLQGGGYFGDPTGDLLWGSDFALYPYDDNQGSPHDLGSVEMWLDPGAGPVTVDLQVNYASEAFELF
jgi:hypothetical protein